MNLDAFLSAIELSNEQVPGTHTIHSEASPEAIAEWQEAHGIRLPADIVALLERADGVGLHQSWFDGQPMFSEGAFHLYGLADLRPASDAMYGRSDYPVPSTLNWLAIGEGPDSAVFYVLNLESRHYLAVSPLVPDEAEDLGPSLDILFERLDPLNPDWSV